MNQTAQSLNTPFATGVALVVGGSGGIGRGICRSLARDGSAVAFTYYSQINAANALLADLSSLGVTASAYAVNLSDRLSTTQMIESVINQHQRIHSLIYCAGADISMTYVADVEPSEWDRTITLELTGFFNVIKAALIHLRNQSGASITAVTSAGIHRHPPLDILSVAPKAGIESLVRGLAREEGRYQIRANSVAPGVIDDGLFDRLRQRVTPKVVEAMRRNTALKRFGSADEVGDLVSFLSSARAGYITGQHICIDGGYSI